MKRALRKVNVPSKTKEVVLEPFLRHTHAFSSDEGICEVQTNLLSWYDTHKRSLQWRDLSHHEDPNIRAYSVLVSEIMLQQTQVATVKSYYSKWIEKWPDLQSLAKASLEEVNTLWSGLGYYSRGRRLKEAACKVVNEMNSIMPTTADKLRQLPGVGPYTAAAIASIAFQEPVGLVDGNVVRVMTRLCSIGGDIGKKATTDAIWKLANEVVDTKRPGDFNQAMMELGATVCTPKSPSCESCPLQLSCRAYRRASSAATLTDIEDVADCLLCLPAAQPWESKDGVTNYPRKGKKTAAKVARNIVFIVEQTARDGAGKEYLLWQRPSTGLLANLWEFPSAASQRNSGDESSELSDAVDQSKVLLPGRAIERFQFVADVFHQFSHISQTYAVYYCSAVRGACEARDDDNGQQQVVIPESYQGFRWLASAEIASTAISTAMKKVFRAFSQNPSAAGRSESCPPPSSSSSLKRKASTKSKHAGTASKRKQTTMQSFFKAELE